MVSRYSKMKTFIAFTLVLGASFAAELRVSCVGKVSPECTAEGEVNIPDLVQGDMVFFNETDEGFGRNAIRRGTWPNGEIPYVFHQSFTTQEKQTILQAMNTIMAQTCVRYVPWNGRGPVTIITKQEAGCYSVVGYAIDGQGYAYLNLQNPGCLNPRGIAEHELLHLSGLFHEQSRPDRDSYVTINWNNIQKEPKDMSHNFDKMTDAEVTTFGLPYDYQSVMHYEKYDFSINPFLPTIVHKTNPNVKLGQRDGPTYYDLEKVRRMYKC